MYMPRFIDSCATGDFGCDSVLSMRFNKLQKIQECPLTEDTQQEAGFQKIFAIQQGL
jgi:hypothetical protein